MEETAKEILIKTIQAQPDSCTAEQILQELLFHQTIMEGLKDEAEGKMISHEEFGKIIKSWAK